MVRIVDTDSLLSETCPSRQVLDLIGDKWTVILLHVICDKSLRYSQIHKQIGGISQKVLTASLRKLERNGIIKRTVHPVVPPWVEYELTDLGRTLFDALEGLENWSVNHLPEVQAARTAYDTTESIAKKQ